MRAIKLLFYSFILLFSLASCTINDDVYHNNIVNQDNSIILERFDLWEVDHSQTSGNGNIPFLDRAITLSYLNGVLYANNNFSGFGYTGNGFGIDVGVYTIGYNALNVRHDIYGSYGFEVIYDGSNRIRLYDSFRRTTYFLYGYNKANYNYDYVFYNNIEYFLQEFNAWRKVYTSNTGALNPFDNENILNFDTQGNIFSSSLDNPNMPLNSIYWDYQGVYSVYNTNNLSQKILRLNYGSSGIEEFYLTVINDNRIRLQHTSGTVYEFEGTGYIQFLRPGLKTTNQIIL